MKRGVGKKIPTIEMDDPSFLWRHIERLSSSYVYVTQKQFLIVYINFYMCGAFWKSSEAIIILKQHKLHLSLWFNLSYLNMGGRRYPTPKYLLYTFTVLENIMDPTVSDPSVQTHRQAGILLLLYKDKNTTKLMLKIRQFFV